VASTPPVHPRPAVRRIAAAVIALALALAAPWAAGRAQSPTEPVEVVVGSLSSGAHAFFHRLLVEALEAGGVRAELRTFQDLPQLRAAAMLETGALSVHWFLRNAERDRLFLPVEGDLTRGLVGKRVMLIRPEEQTRFDGVRTAEDLRATGAVAGLGAGWFDVEVWRANALPLVEQHGEWQTMYRLLAAGGRGIDYFPRGATEVLDEARRHPELAVERGLLLVYDHDFRFYVSPARGDLVGPLRGGLAVLRESGRHAELLDEHFGAALRVLGVDDRVAIRLRSPE